LSFKCRDYEYKEDNEIPLPELAEKLLLELEVINKLPVDTRGEAKEAWNAKFNNYLERKQLEKSEVVNSTVELRAIK
jgi:hypothetical protein